MDGPPALGQAPVAGFVVRGDCVAAELEELQARVPDAVGELARGAVKDVREVVAYIFVSRQRVLSYGHLLQVQAKRYSQRCGKKSPHII